MRGVGTIHKSQLQSQDVLVVGNPTMPTNPLIEPPQPLNPLPEAEAKAEAKAIASLLNTQPIIGAQATKVNIVQQMPKARLIHLATHGLLDDIKQLGVPGAIALAPCGEDNGFLTAGEIYAGRSKRVAEVRINRYLKDIRDRAPYPFANPVYWSAFTTIGL